MKHFSSLEFVWYDPRFDEIRVFDIYNHAKLIVYPEYIGSDFLLNFEFLGVL